MTKAAEDTIFVLMWSHTMEGCIEVKVKDTWIPVRIEMDTRIQWYLVGFPRTKLDGLRVRI